MQVSLNNKDNFFDKTRMKHFSEFFPINISLALLDIGISQNLL